MSVRGDLGTLDKISRLEERVREALRGIVAATAAAWRQGRPLDEVAPQCAARAATVARTAEHLRRLADAAGIDSAKGSPGEFDPGDFAEWLALPLEDALAFTEAVDTSSSRAWRDALCFAPAKRGRMQ